MRSGTKICLQIGLLIAGAAMVAFGAYRGEVQTVFGKAIRLCMECVGIG